MDEAADGVVREVPEAQGDTAQVLQAPVDRLGGAVGGTGVVEVGQDVVGSAFERSAQRDELGQTPRYTRGGQGVDFGFHQGLTHVHVGRAVGTR